MEAITVSKQSWHYKLMREWAGRAASDMPDDLCAYLRALMFDIFKIAVVATFMLIVVAVVLLMFGDLFAYIVAVALYGLIFPNGAAFALLTVMVIGLLSGAFYLLITRAAAVRIDIPAPSFAAAAYRSLKDRVCYRLDYK